MRPHQQALRFQAPLEPPPPRPVPGPRLPRAGEAGAGAAALYVVLASAAVTCADVDTLNAWLKRHRAPIDGLATDAPALWAALRAIVQAHRGALAGGVRGGQGGADAEG
jgi:hypothetical protein